MEILTCFCAHGNFGQNGRGEPTSFKKQAVAPLELHPGKWDTESNHFVILLEQSEIE